MDRSFPLVLLLTFALAMAPLALLSGRLLLAGEIAPDRSRALTHPDERYGRLVDDNMAYKRAMLAVHRPRLTVLGSSRVMTLTSTIFTRCGDDPTCFYNAGGLAPTTRIGLDALKEIPPDRFPEVILLGLDYWMIASNPTDDHASRPFELEDPFDRLKRTIAEVRTVMQEARSDPVLLGGLVRFWEDKPGTGIRARLKGVGFRRDGSHDYGPEALVRISDPGRNKQILSAAETGTFYFAGGGTIDPTSLAELRGMLSVARERGARVIGYTPPFIEEVGVASSRGGWSAGWHAFAGAAEAVFAEMGFPFFAMTTLGAAGCRPDESLDGFHPTEPCSARIVRRMLEDPGAAAALAPFVDAAALDRLLAQRASALSLR